jgi:hypothetical protein
MRTTLNIDDEALAEVRKYAEQRSVSLGEAASSLIFRGAGGLPTFRKKNGWVVFDTPPDASVLTNELLDAWETSDLQDELHNAITPRR